MSLHDAPDINAHMDTSPIQSPANNITSAFTSLVHSQSEDSLLQNPLPQTSHDSLPIFPNTVDPSTLPLSLPDMSPSNAGISPMDTLSVSSSTRTPAPGYISDFPPRTLPFAVAPQLDSHLSVQSPPSTSSGSSSQSPPVLGIVSAFPSASASAIPSVPAAVMSAMSLSAPTSALESSASSTLVGSGSELGFSPVSGAPLPSSREPGFVFPPPDVLDSRSNGRDSPPESPSDSHLMVVGDMLQTIAQTAQSARAACSLGQGFEANVRIDELKKTITLVSELIAATQIADPPSISRKSSPRRFSGVSAMGSANSVSPPSRHPTITAVPDTGQSVMHFSAGHQELNAMDTQGSLDTSDLSRKRCASSMGGNRVNKALKREPQEDTPLHVFPSSTTNPPVFPPITVPSMVDPRGVPPFVPSNSPSEPASRPTSSAELPHHAFSLLPHQPAQPPMLGMSFSIPTTSASSTSADFISTSPLSTTIAHPTHFPAPVRTSWSDGAMTLPQRTHQHTHSGSSLSNAINYHPIPSTSTGLAPLSFSTTGTFVTTSSQSRPVTGGGAGISPPIGRVSRSGSFTNSNVNAFGFGLPEVSSVARALDFLQAPTSTTAPKQVANSPTSSHDGENDVDSDGGGDHSQSHSPESSSGNHQRSAAQIPASRSLGTHNSRSNALLTRNSMENLTMTSHGNEVPQEYRAEVDNIFFEFLNSICSNLEATDAKGEPIHQTLMAKKMQRLDESPDFRPFKFRIQAFTNAFLEELARQGYPEEKIPMKKIRNYLWNQPYISRFNEDGKKTKSKGNHIWNIDAKKKSDGGWTFRPFHRKVAGSPPSVAYVGLRWCWTPRIWDPQTPRTNLAVMYSSPFLPSWLSWEDDVLQGTPPLDAESCDITVVARYIQDGVEEKLTQTFHLNIAPVSTLDASFPAPRRSSLNGDIHKPRRISSDTTVSQVTPPRPLRSATTSALTPPVATHDAQVMQVLTTAAQRVAQEAQSQVIASTSSIDPGPELQALAKQQHVLTVTAQAFDQEVSGQGSEGPLQGTHVLAAAAQQVVLQAARQVAADRSAAVASQISAGLPPPAPGNQVTVNEVSVATQSAVAQAVEITGPLSSEVDVLMTASSLLQQQFLTPPHSTGNLSASPFPSGLTAPTNVPYPPSGPLSDFNRLP
ncbi:hypothetical protein PAXRUDRAFT_823568 [Paxillus rubicundulus Ve08.2h10]|uniref:Uncharacterized protein n=1 Tax=Paxillus rubicundulus Ve08.2h10 TaxID=930991 RepID=A0A0D0DVD5_9AGAM|nr:hypothetical protein PAXRUDRAFT_823568 [Paxillus rubicundulus Ve08.2h10]